MILVSACLLGENCRYDGGHSLKKELEVLLEDREYKAICPEVAGGLTIPRSPSEIKGGSGKNVLEGDAFVYNKKAENVSSLFIHGAKEILKGIEPRDVKLAILKSRSPSCGVHQIYNGEFTGKLREGSGVTAAYLQSKGIPVFTEEELKKIKIELKK